MTIAYINQRKMDSILLGRAGRFLES